MIETKREVGKMIKSMVFAVAAPIIVDARWPDIPENLRADVKLERMKAQMNGSLSDDEALDIEALAYMSSVSLAQPLNGAWYRIYVNLFKKYCDAKGIEMPFDASNVGELDNYEMKMLGDLKRWIRKKQNQALKMRARAKS